MQEILGLVRRCVEDYDMIQAGDTVAVASPAARIRSSRSPRSRG